MKDDYTNQRTDEYANERIMKEFERVNRSQATLKIIQGHCFISVINSERIGKSLKYVIKEMKGPYEIDKPFWSGTFTQFFDKDDEKQELVKENAPLYLSITTDHPDNIECYTIIQTVISTTQFKVGNYYEIGFCGIVED